MSQADPLARRPARALIALGIVVLMAVSIAAAVLITAVVIDDDGSPSGSPLAGVEMVYAPSEVAPFGLALVEASCPAGKIVTGGGTYSDAVSSTLLVLDSAPVKHGARYAWRARFANKSGGTVPVGSVAICVARPGADGGPPARSRATGTTRSTTTGAPATPTATTAQP